jgi:hypothetical protein
MQKINNISCCAECSACKPRMGGIPYCAKTGRRIDEDTETPVNPALTGFPKWCPLDSVKTPGEMDVNYKKEIKRIMKIMEDDSNADALSEASHYLNSVVGNAKNRNE